MLLCVSAKQPERQKRFCEIKKIFAKLIPREILNKSRYKHYFLLHNIRKYFTSGSGRLSPVWKLSMPLTGINDTHREGEREETGRDHVFLNGILTNNIKPLKL